MTRTGDGKFDPCVDNPEEATLGPVSLSNHVPAAADAMKFVDHINQVKKREVPFLAFFQLVGHFPAPKPSKGCFLKRL